MRRRARGPAEEVLHTCPVVSGYGAGVNETTRVQEPSPAGAEPGGRRGVFGRFTAAPEDGGPHFGRFVEAMRRLQDLAVSAAPDDPEVFGAAADRAEELAALLAPHAGAEGEGPANRSVGLPGRGSLLMLPWTVTAREPGRSVRATGVFRRYHLGGNGAAHGGVLPLLFDDMFGMASHVDGGPVSRTAYLTVNYRAVTPLETPLTLDVTVDSVEGRKTMVSGRLHHGATLLADAEALMVRLLPGQP